MGVEFKFGQMDHAMMDSGEIVWLMVMVDWSMLKVMFMRVNGLMIKQMEWAYIHIIKEADMLANGVKINSMVMVLNNGQMEPNLKVIMQMVSNMEKENSYGVIKVNILVNSLTIIFMV